MLLDKFSCCIDKSSGSYEGDITGDPIGDAAGDWNGEAGTDIASSKVGGGAKFVAFGIGVKSVEVTVVAMS